MTLKSLFECGGLLVLEAGSEQSTNFRWWDFEISKPSLGRLDLNHPPTPVGGISEFSTSLYLVVVMTSWDRGKTLKEHHRSHD
jgi:hypothetical protein